MTDHPTIRNLQTTGHADGKAPEYVEGDYCFTATVYLWAEVWKEDGCHTEEDAKQVAEERCRETLAQITKRDLATDWDGLAFSEAQPLRSEP